MIIVEVSIADTRVFANTRVFGKITSRNRSTLVMLIYPNVPKSKSFIAVEIALNTIDLMTSVLG